MFVPKKRIILYKIIEEPTKPDPTELCTRTECDRLKSGEEFCEYHHPSRYCATDGCQNFKSWWSPDGGLCEEHETESYYKYKHRGIYPKHVRFVYLMYSNRLSALKIGIGQYGRIEQIKRSEYINPMNQKREKALWYVLKIGRFSTRDEQSTTALPKFLNAEKQVLKYWHEELGIGPFLRPESIGLVCGSNDSLGGSSETVKLGSACEIETWRRVQDAEGYLGDKYFSMRLDLTPRSKRPLMCGQAEHQHNNEVQKNFSKPKISKNNSIKDSVNKLAGVIKVLGVDSATDKTLVIKDGRFGMYVTDGETNATLRRHDSADSMTLERGLELLAGRREWEAQNGGKFGLTY